MIKVYDTKNKRVVSFEELVATKMTVGTLFNSCNRFEPQRNTGQVDISGKEIYEGDVLLDCNNGTGKVHFADGAFRVSGVGRGVGGGMADDCDEVLDRKIIGRYMLEVIRNTY